MTVTTEDKLADAFFVLGCQYYAIARFSAENLFMPVCATLFHHAIEMILKGYLVQNHSLSELKKIGHYLPKLWKLFKSTRKNNLELQLDTTISRLDQVEILRYPDSMVNDGFVLNIRQGSPTAARDIPGAENTPQYFVNVSDLDAIVLSIFSAREINPTVYFKSVPTELKNSLPSSLLSIK